MDVRNISMNCTLTEFVGTAALDSIALVIGGVDDKLHEKMGIPEKYQTLGVFSSMGSYPDIPGRPFL